MCSSVVFSLYSKRAGRKSSRVDWLFGAYHLGISRWSSLIYSVSNATLQVCGFPAKWDFLRIFSVYYYSRREVIIYRDVGGEVSALFWTLMSFKRRMQPTRPTRPKPTSFSKICLPSSTICWQYVHTLLHHLHVQRKMNKLTVFNISRYSIG